MDLQVCGGWERVIGQVPCKGISCPEEVALSKAHSGMKEGDSGKALLQVFSISVWEPRQSFPLLDRQGGPCSGYLVQLPLLP